MPFHGQRTITFHALITTRCRGTCPPIVFVDHSTTQRSLHRSCITVELLATQPNAPAVERQLPNAAYHQVPSKLIIMSINMRVIRPERPPMPEAIRPHHRGTYRQQRRKSHDDFPQESAHKNIIPEQPYHTRPLAADELQSSIGHRNKRKIFLTPPVTHDRLMLCFWRSGEAARANNSDRPTPVLSQSDTAPRSTAAGSMNNRPMNKP